MKSVIVGFNGCLQLIAVYWIHYWLEFFNIQELEQSWHTEKTKNSQQPPSTTVLCDDTEWKPGYEIENEGALRVVLGNLFQIVDDIVSFLVEVLLAKAENHIK